MLSFLATPLALFFLLVVASLLLRRVRRAWGTVLMAGACAGLYLLATPLVGGWLLHALELPAGAGTADDVVQPAAIVVLGGDLQGDPAGPEGETIGPLSLERLRAAAQLQRRTGLPLLTTGGLLRGGEKPVATIMAEVLETDFGVPVTWRETRSINTYENAKFSAELLAAQGIGQVYLVTHGWHLRRSVEAFREAGLKSLPVSAVTTTLGPGLILGDLLPSARALLHSSYAVHEIVGMLWYRLRYY